MSTHHFQRSTERRVGEFIVDRVREYVPENEFQPIPPVLCVCIGPKDGLQSCPLCTANQCDKVLSVKIEQEMSGAHREHTHTSETSIPVLLSISSWFMLLHMLMS